MLYSDTNAEPTEPYLDHEAHQQSTYPLTTPPTQPTPPRGRFPLRAVVLVAALLVVLNIGLFAGWQIGRNDPTTTALTSATLQTGTAPTVTVPALTANNIETVREAVIAKVRPAVVEVTVTTLSGTALGSGVIIDSRGYIVTNNHVVDGATELTVSMSDKREMKARLIGTDAKTGRVGFTEEECH